MTGPTCLYRHFAKDGSLLYVGVSLSWPQRTKAHAKGARWFADIDQVKIEHFPTRQEALDAEREAIKRERPRFNVVHNRGETKQPRRAVARRWADQRNPLVREIEGPHALVGPALVYRGDAISVMVAHGEFGSAGKLTELVLGERFPDLPAWTDVCETVLTIRRPNEITIVEARCQRMGIIATLRLYLKSVQPFDSDLAFARANAARFPSQKSREILHDVSRDEALKCR